LLFLQLLGFGFFGRSRLVSGGLVLDRPMQIFWGGVGVQCLVV
jgi:hypothetical protein